MNATRRSYLPVPFNYSLLFRLARDPMVVLDLYSTQNFTAGQRLCIKIRRKTTKEPDPELSNSMFFLRLGLRCEFVSVSTRALILLIATCCWTACLLILQMPSTRMTDPKKHSAK